MVDAFSKFDENATQEEIKKGILMLTDYPVEIVEKFLNAANAVSEHLITPENSQGILAYITLRINL
jgi:hypothetical protein